MGKREKIREGTTRRMRALCFGVVVAMLLVACGGADDESIAEPDDPVDPGEDVEVADPADDGDADPEAVLRWGIATDAGSMYDPHRATNPQARTYLYPVYDRLVYFTPDGDLEPMLAESWEYGDAGQSLDVTLRDGAVFHDGTPVDAEAVRANIERAQTLEGTALRRNLANVEDVEVVDDRTVRFHLSEPDTTLIGELADRGGMLISPAAFDNDDLDLMPVGAGPFRIVEHDPGVLVAYERFDDYWDPEYPKFQRLEIHPTPDGDLRIRNLQDGTVDAARLEPDLIPGAERAGLDVTSYGSISHKLIWLNLDHPDLEILEVRQAIQHAIDREAIGETIFDDGCNPEVQIFPPGHRANSPDVDRSYYDYDPDRARELLADVGRETGVSFTTTVLGQTFFISYVEAIQAQLADVGIEMDILPLEPARLIPTFAIDRDADAYATTWIGSVDPGGTVTEMYLPESFFNPGGYEHPEIVELAGQARAELDDDARDGLYQELSRATVEDSFHIVLCTDDYPHAAADHVRGFAANPLWQADFREVWIQR